MASDPPPPRRVQHQPATKQSPDCAALRHGTAWHGVLWLRCVAPRCSVLRCVHLCGGGVLLRAVVLMACLESPTGTTRVLPHAWHNGLTLTEGCDQHVTGHITWGRRTVPSGRPANLHSSITA